MAEVDAEVYPTRTSEDWGDISPFSFFFLSRFPLSLFNESTSMNGSFGTFGACPDGCPVYQKEERSSVIHLSQADGIVDGHLSRAWCVCW